MTITSARPQAPPAIPELLELEITGRCQLTCPTLCYAKSGPTNRYGKMSTTDWKRLINDAAEVG